MKRALLTLALASLLGCNAINGFEDLEKVDSIDSTTPDTQVVETEAPDTAMPDTEVPDTELPDTTVADTELPDTEMSDTADVATDSGDDAPVDAGPCGAPSRTCYPGPSGTLGVGACVAGTEYCVDGDWGPCIGAVVPSLETCNNVDDDCNGTVDDNLGTITCGLGACKKTVYACTAGVPTACVPTGGAAETC